MPETPASHVETLKRRFAYGDWVPRARRRDTLFVWNAAVVGDELPGMTMERVKRIEPSAVIESRNQPEAARDRMAEAPRVHVESLWRDDRWPGVLVRVDIFECLSAGDARQKALWLLGEFESPLVERTHDVGDVAFVTRGDGLILFVRANLVYLLRNIDRRTIAMRQAALALDAAAVSTLESRRRTIPVIHSEARETGSSQVVEATLHHAGEGTDPPVSLKFVAPDGEIALRGGTIVYEGPRLGLERLAVYESRTG